MAAPEGVKKARWDQAVRAIVDQTGMTTNDADAWLNGVWVEGWNGDEVFGDPVAHAELKKFLEFNRPNATTLPMALNQWMTD